MDKEDFRNALRGLGECVWEENDEAEEVEVENDEGPDPEKDEDDDEGNEGGPDEESVVVPAPGAARGPIAHDLPRHINISGEWSFFLLTISLGLRFELVGDGSMEVTADVGL